jgi:hypothetical protein
MCCFSYLFDPVYGRKKVPEPEPVTVPTVVEVKRRLLQAREVLDERYAYLQEEHEKDKNRRGLVNQCGHLLRLRPVRKVKEKLLFTRETKTVD